MFEPSARDPIPQIRLAGCLVISLILFAACLMPLMLVNVAQAALTNLHLEPASALLVLFGMLLGSVINLPIARFPLDKQVVVPVFGPIGGWNVFPRYQRIRQEMVVAVNVGGCVIPVLLAVWLMRFILSGTATVGITLLIGMLVNTAVCFSVARPVPNLGIALPFFLPAMIALSVTWLGLGDSALQVYRAPVAFVIGITGPLLGADLLHWKDFQKIAVGSVSIGGAGTWDGIVLSGLLAALLA